MDYIQKARELGREIQATEEYKAFRAAAAASDADGELSNMIGEFNLVRMQINNEITKKEKNQEEIDRLDKSLKEIYEKIMQNENMINYNNAKSDFDRVVNTVNTIIGMSVNGHDPDTIDPEQNTCGGSCASCAGCH